MLVRCFCPVAVQAVGETSMIEDVDAPVAGVVMAAQAGAWIVVCRCYVQMTGLTIPNPDVLVFYFRPITDAGMAQVAITRVMLATIRREWNISAVECRVVAGQEIACSKDVLGLRQIVQVA